MGGGDVFEPIAWLLQFGVIRAGIYVIVALAVAGIVILVRTGGDKLWLAEDWEERMRALWDEDGDGDVD
jgi:hypothetical protein